MVARDADVVVVRQGGMEGWWVGRASRHADSKCGSLGPLGSRYSTGPHNRGPCYGSHRVPAELRCSSSGWWVVGGTRVLCVPRAA